MADAENQQFRVDTALAVCSDPNLISLPFNIRLLGEEDY